MVKIIKIAFVFTAIATFAAHATFAAFAMIVAGTTIAIVEATASAIIIDSVKNSFAVIVVVVWRLNNGLH